MSRYGAERIARGPLEEVLAIAKQIADAPDARCPPAFMIQWRHVPNPSDRNGVMQDPDPKLPPPDPDPVPEPLAPPSLPEPDPDEPSPDLIPQIEPAFQY